MIFSFFCSILFFLYFSYTIYHFSLWDKVESTLILFIFTTFISPALYFGFISPEYNIETVHLLNIFSIVTIAVLSLLIYFSHSTHTLSLNRYCLSSSNPLGRIYVFVLSLSISIWMILNFKAFPIYGWLSQTIVVRPDTQPTIPFFYTLSTVLYFIVPSFLFFFKDKLNKYSFFFFFAIISILLSAGGHKGVLVYLFIFTWWFILKRKLNFKLLLLTVISFSFYFINMNTINGYSFNISHLLKDGAKRFFIEQTRGLIVRFEMVAQGFEFSSIIPIKRQVGEYLWHTPIGTLPTVFFGDIYVTSGLFSAMGSIVLVFLLLFGILYLYQSFWDDLIFKWTIFSIFFLLFMAEISQYSFLRIFAIFSNFWILSRK